MTDEEAFAVCRDAVVGLSAAQALTIIANLLAFILFQRTDPTDDDEVWKILRQLTEEAVRNQPTWQ